MRMLGREIMEASHVSVLKNREEESCSASSSKTPYARHTNHTTRPASFAYIYIPAIDVLRVMSLGVFASNKCECDQEC